MDSNRGQLQNPVSLNRYVYAAGDPVNLTDATGDHPVLTVMGLIGAALSIAAFIAFAFPLSATAALIWGAVGAVGVAIDIATVTTTVACWLSVQC